MAPEKVVGQHPTVKVALASLSAIQTPERFDPVPERPLQPLAQVIIDVGPYPLGLDMRSLRQHVLDRLYVSPNPPMDGARTGEGGKGVTGAMIRARIRVDGRLAGGLQALLGAPMSACSGCGERDGRIGHGKRRSRTGMA